jgi:hypothetical protein
MNWLAFSCFAFLVCWLRYRLEIMQRDLHEAQALEALLADGLPPSSAGTGSPINRTPSGTGTA